MDQYPWGNQEPELDLGNISNNIDDTTPVGSYPYGISPFGALYLAGNVKEWVADWYAAGYYHHAPKNNPQGPDSGTHRGVQGGSWLNYAFNLRSSLRTYDNPDNAYYDVGFRCASPP